MKQTKTDVLIIGSGPIGAAYARMINDALPDTEIIMIDLGPKVSDTIGQHVSNITDPEKKERAQVLSQGPQKKVYPMVSVPERAMAVQRGDLKPEYLARAGTHLVSDNPEDLKANDMPAMALATAGAARPAALMRRRQPICIGASPPTSSVKPSSVTAPCRSGA